MYFSGDWRGGGFNLKFKLDNRYMYFVLFFYNAIVNELLFAATIFRDLQG